MTRLDALTEEFFRIEDEFGLLKRTFQGVHAWERVRFWVHQRCLSAADVDGTRTRRYERSIIHRGLGILASSVWRNPLLANRPEITIFGHPRRKLRPDGLWWDIYADPYLEMTDRRYVYCELPFRGVHRRPAKTSSVFYLDFVSVFQRACRARIAPKCTLSRMETSLLADVERRLVAGLGVRLELAKRVGQSLSHRACVLPVFNFLLRRLAPKLVLIVCSYGNETFVEACKNLGIPVAEIQHGVISRYQLGYSYPDPETTKRTFPDYLFTFGEHWNGVCRYPIPESRVLPVGFPYQESEWRRYAHVRPLDRILFLSQWTVGEDLARLAVEVARQLPARTEVLFKLHPRECETWEAQYPWLVGSRVTVVDGDNPPLYELLASSRMHVGVSTTALFEGLVFDRETVIVDLPTSEHAEKLVETNRACLVHTTEELLRRVAEPRRQESFDTSEYFRPNALGNMHAVVEGILEERA